MICIGQRKMLSIRALWHLTLMRACLFLEENLEECAACAAFGCHNAENTMGISFFTLRKVSCDDLIVILGKL